MNRFVHILENGKAEFISYSFDVKVEGKNVPRLGDSMIQNCGSPGNTPPIPEVQASLVVVTSGEEEEGKKKKCIKLPDAAPQNLIGKCKYYNWRFDNFIKRHKKCQHKTPPDYYLNYGLKYCKIFSTETCSQTVTRGTSLARTHTYFITKIHGVRA